MLMRSRVKWALTALTVLFAGLHANTLAAQSGPSLDETLKWLKDFLPSATGANYQMSDGTNRDRVSLTTSLDVIIRMHNSAQRQLGDKW